ncbi:hypothetical protein ACLB2K_032463 [Fragaria x ananassa]
MHKDKIFKLAKGFRGRAKNCIRIARERVEKALQYSYRDRRTKKRDMRALWIQRINAGTRIHGFSGAIRERSKMFKGKFDLLRGPGCECKIPNSKSPVTSDSRRGERQNMKQMKIVADCAGQGDWDFVVAIGNCET